MGLKEGDAQAVTADAFENSYQLFAEYIEWRADHPSDDLMTQLLNAEIEEDGVLRPLTRTEVLTYTSMIAGAGNETTTRLIGFIGQLLSEHPDQRRQLVGRLSLDPWAIEEVLRYEAPSPVQARYVAHDTECRGETIPEGSVMLLLNGSANRDERHFPTASVSTSTAAVRHSVASGRACTSVSVPHWRGCRHVWRSRKSSSAGPNGKSITTMRRWRTPPACAAGEDCRPLQASVVAPADATQQWCREHGPAMRRAPTSRTMFSGSH